MPSVKATRALIIGATSGIGKAIAERLVSENVPVVVVGRRQELLDEFVKTHGSDKAASVQFDITQTDKTKGFVEGVMQKYPDIDFVLFNSGMLREFLFTNPSAVDLAEFELELTTNYVAMVHLTRWILPIIQARRGVPTNLVYMSSGLGIVPQFQYPGYSGTKAAIHAFAMCLRAQLVEEFPHIQIKEIVPPAVQSELLAITRGKEVGANFGLPMKTYIDEMWTRLNDGRDTVFASTQPVWEDIEKQRRGQFELMTGNIKKGTHKSTKYSE